ncbi:MAG: hypothetical protein V3U07_08140 [Nitrospirales bacterium]
MKEFKVLMTHPGFGEWRETQEGRAEGAIRLEIQESIQILTRDWKLEEENIHFYKGAPTVFLLFTPERMLLNPYTYQTEAFKTVTFEVEPSRAYEKDVNPQDVYSQYVENHFRRPWKSSNRTLLSELPNKKSPTLGNEGGQASKIGR